MSSWLATNWFPLIESLGIMASLLLSASAFRTSSQVRRTEVALALTQAHRDIWRVLPNDEKLVRVLDPNADIISQPTSKAEETFVLSVLLHLSTAVEAIREGALKLPEGFETDIREFLSLPIPREVAKIALPYQQPSFQRFLKPFLE